MGLFNLSWWTPSSWALGDIGDGCDSRACIGARYVVAWRSPVRFMAIMAVLVARESAMWGQIAKAVEPR
jgi:hypothetical protein